MSEATKEKIAASKRGKNFWTPESKAKRLATIQKKKEST